MTGIYVEIDIHCAMDDLWARTQLPELHRRWDLRFTDIEYLPRPDTTQPQRFLYATRIGFGMRIDGEGETQGTRESDGSRTSALKFWSDDLKSLIREGSGYWQYLPIPDGIRFLTWYDYSTRFGFCGRFFDGLVFRRLLGWATAWSFDRLRLWLEHGIDPADSLRQSVIYAMSRLAIAMIWIYQGLVPKLLTSNIDELAMMKATGIADAGAALQVIGFAEIAMGLALIVAWRARSLLVVTTFLMIVALASVAGLSPVYLTSAFNPVTLNTAMIALSVIGLVAGKDLPSAARCKRKKSGGSE